MKNYTVIVRPDDRIGAETVVKLQTDGTRTRITQIQLTAGDDNGLSVAQLPAINLELLLAAILPATAPAPTLTQTQSASPAVATEPAGNAATAATNGEQPDRATTEPNSVMDKPQQPKLADMTARTKNGPGSAGRTVTPKATAVTSKPPKAKQAPSDAARAAAEPQASGRTYRTLPEDFADVYRQGGTVAAVADQYQVPTHTVNGWMRTARKRGLIPSAPARASR